MFEAGFVSVSFRGHSVEEIAKEAVKAGLKYIEWGSDVHAPCNDIAALERIVALQKQFGLICCSYGTYFRLGVTALEELPDYIRAAKILGTNILRLWAGGKSPWLWTDSEKADFFELCRKAANIARDADVLLCLECHRNTFTETKEAAMELMQAVNSPHFAMYWQPNPSYTVEENLAYARHLKDYTTHLHAFHQNDTEKFPLAQGAEHWHAYLKEFSGDHKVLLEFMPDNRIETLQREAVSLWQIIADASR